MSRNTIQISLFWDIFAELQPFGLLLQYYICRITMYTSNDAQQQVFLHWAFPVFTNLSLTKLFYIFLLNVYIILISIIISPETFCVKLPTIFLSIFYLLSIDYYCIPGRKSGILRIQCGHTASAAEISFWMR